MPLEKSARAALLCFVLLSSTAARDISSPSFRGFPNVVLWAWERREDLHALDSSRYAVAYLDRTLFLGRTLTVRPRLQPIRFPEGARVVAVIRIQPQFLGPIDDALLDPTSDAILAAVAKPFVNALQIDFDATVSQRSFYRALLSRVRPRLRSGMPLSITALVSWCSSDDWIGNLPIDEAVPMFFRMTPGTHRVRPGFSVPIREPLCSTSAGVSTDEAWPQLSSGLRLFVFHPRAWNPVALADLNAMVRR